MRAALLLCLTGTLAFASEDLRWAYDGHAQLPDAAADAKRAGRRLLVGLAGSPT